MRTRRSGMRDLARTFRATFEGHGSCFSLGPLVKTVEPYTNWCTVSHLNVNGSGQLSDTPNAIWGLVLFLRALGRGKLDQALNLKSLGHTITRASRQARISYSSSAERSLPSLTIPAQGSGISTPIGVRALYHSTLKLHPPDVHEPWGRRW